MMPGEGANPAPFVLTLSKHRSSFAAKEERPFDKLRANGLYWPRGAVVSGGGVHFRIAALWSRMALNSEPSFHVGQRAEFASSLPIV